MNSPEARFVFAGHAIGAAARFHRLDDTHGLNHITPTLAPSVLTVIGGHSHASVSDYHFRVDHPRPRTLLSIRQIMTSAQGGPTADGYKTEVNSVINGVTVVDKLHVDHIQSRLTAIRNEKERQSDIAIGQSRLEGLRLGAVQAHVELDEEPFAKGCNKQTLAEFYQQQSPAYRQENAWRFHTPEGAETLQEHHGKYICSLVKKITLQGMDKELEQVIKVEGYTITWTGFGRIILGEVLIRDHDRRVTMVRLKMGSDAGGEAVFGDGHSNGTTMP